MAINTARRPRGWARGLTAVTAVCLFGTLVITPDAGADGRTPVDGVWQTDGYGSVIEIANGQAQTYETTRISCAMGPSSAQAGPVGPDGTVRFTNDDVDFTMRADQRRQRAALRIDSSVGEQHLRRLPALPELCTLPGRTGRLATFDVFWTTFAENYPFFAAKGVDWAQVRDKYRPMVREDMTDDQLFALLTEMVTPLGDAHVGIRAGERVFLGHRPGTTFPTQELEDKVRSVIEHRDLDGKPLQEFGRKRIGYAELPGRIGYLRLVAFAGYTKEGYAADAAELNIALDTVLTKDKTSGPNALRSLIIDLRVNGGGHDPLGLQIAARLTRHPYLAYAKQTRNDADDPTRFTRPQPQWVLPAKAPVYTGPIAMLTGGSTVSAGETFTQALLDRSPRPVRIGENTQGVFSDLLERTLPNGWMFALPNERYLTRSGQTFDGAGIPPHVRTPVFTDEEFAANRDSAFDRAVGLLRRST